MTDLFLSILNMSITASWLILALLLIRFLLKKAPKSFTCLLWLLVGIRLMVPITFESVFSLIPSANTISNDVVTSSKPIIQSGIEIVDNTVNPILSNETITIASQRLDLMEVIISIACIIWILGVPSMLMYSVVSYIKLQRQVGASLHLKDNIYFCDDISTAFILGVIHPKIYIPSMIKMEYVSSILAHENAHLKRKDHIWKIIGFIILSIHWFNPVVWIAYIMFGRDIELACDELVTLKMEDDSKKEYCKALVSFNEQNRLLLVCPLAFGEIGVKERIKQLVNYKKPAFWIIVVACALCIVTVVGFMSNPITDKTIKISDINGDTYYSNYTKALKYIDQVQVGNEECSYTLIYEEDLKEVINLLDSIELKKEPASTDTSRDNRFSTNYILLGKKYGYGNNIKIYFNENFDQIWLDNNVTPTYVYSVKNNDLIKQLYTILNESDEENTLTTMDVFVKEINDEGILVQEIENAKCDYFISTSTKKEGTDLFRENEPLKIVYSSLQGEYINDENTVFKLQDVDEIYYLNTLLCTKKIGASSYYSEEEINKCMDKVLESSPGLAVEFNMVELYYDEDEVNQYFKDIESWKTAEDEIIIFANLKQSRSVGNNGLEAKARWTCKMGSKYANVSGCSIDYN